MAGNALAPNYTWSFTTAAVAQLAASAGKIAVGPFHTCAVKADATVACWGHGSNREVLPGSLSDQWTPVVVPGLTGMTYVAVSYQRSCAIDNFGVLSCWGGGLTTPTAIKDGNNVTYTGLKAVAMGTLHTCFIDANTNVQCFGRNSLGQLGDGSPVGLGDPYVAVPVFVQRLNSVPLTGVISLAAGDNHTCALTNSGEVVCWGSGPIGDGSTRSNIAVVPAIASGAMTIGSGAGHVCAAMAAGGLKCWGSNGFGQLGNADATLASQLVPVSVRDLRGLLTGVTAIAARSGNKANTCAIPASGRVVCWGAVAPASLNGTNTWDLAEQGNLAARVTSLASGWSHTCVLVVDGSVECWGDNQFGQLGLGHLQAINVGGPTLPSTSVIGGAIFWK